MIKNLRQRAFVLKRQVTTLYLCYLHRGVKWYQKAFVLLVVAYAVSPIDLIPDFIPVVGLLDDLLLIPLGVVIAIRIIPKEIWAECAKKAADGVAIGRKYGIFGTAAIVLIWAVLIAVAVAKLLYLF